LTKAIQKKIEKYEGIIKEAQKWLNRNEEEIKIEHKIAKINITCKYVVISKLEIVSKTMEEDVCSISSTNKNEKLRYGGM
jgi:hypothetical protein